MLQTPTQQQPLDPDRAPQTRRKTATVSAPDQGDDGYGGDWPAAPWGRAVAADGRPPVDGAPPPPQGESDRERRVAVPLDIGAVAFRDAAQLRQADRNLRQWPLEDERGRSLCWRLGQQSAGEFLAGSGVVDGARWLFNAPQIKLFFPVQGLYFAVRRVNLREKRATVRAILRAVETFARQAIAFHLVRYVGQRHATAAEVQAQLQGLAVCRLLCKRAGGANHVYVQ